MHGFSFSEIAKVLGSTTLQQHSDPLIESLLTDSRKLVFPDKTLFFPISSPQKNAHVFFAPLYEKGVRCFIAGPEFNLNDLAAFPGANIIQVNDVIAALQQIVYQHRKRFSYPVIGITGSNGKTIVKEWLYQLLNERFNIVRNPKSYNSQVGVPLSVWQMNEAHTLGIFEAGISMPGEMQRLQPIIDPEIGVISFIGDAHNEGFENMRQKIDEKLLLFTNSRLLIYGMDDIRLQEAVTAFKKESNPGLTLFTWSREKMTDLYIPQIESKAGGSIIHCVYAEQSFSFFIPFTDDASVNNAITCCCVMLGLGENLSSIPAHMNQLRPVEMRLELKQGNNNCSIINDSYSADVNSLVIALDFLAQQQQHSKKTVILSDVLQTGQPEAVLYKHIADILLQKNLFRFIGIGPGISANAAVFDALPQKQFFNNTEAFIGHLHEMHFHDETILLKGARLFQFENISRALEQKLHETLLEINLNALRNNLKIYSSLLKKDVKLMAMVKAFSYGSGSFEIANLLQHAGADYLAVAYTDEGVELRKAGIRLPIMVMNTDIAGFDNLLRYRLEPEIYSFNILDSFRYYLQQQKVTHYPVHIKLDTGMHRLGFLLADLDPLCEVLATSEQLQVKSVFSHLVGSDNPEHDPFTKQQASVFIQMVTQLEKAIGYSFIKHIANTSAIHRHPDMQFDMVRLGIGLYGVDDRQPLQNVTTLRTTISQIKQIQPGESVGYNRRAVVNRPSSIATVRIGYADGYPRLLGNGTGKMLVNGKLAPVIGNVCMDMTMLDITGIPAGEGDDVIVFGESLPVSDVAGWASTIAYEMLTNISQRVKRVYYEE
ncbi:MAG TPA: bifunctional UDP-N-acetylmuramoyl-tripeptide:D-alanyl-D-alanine ligase/alanine racemase [Ferruginibacter sp.]|nr:bifunctional UDP-N-acetylmuramoyl-tripeptide:D-alanyl-D-alanine ligase/alanine racemase [Ferruginibacter sp.]